jgi:exodeoxyribonuclease VII large subunit
MFESLDSAPDVYSVTGLTAYIRTLLESNDLLQDVWVKGEVSNMTRAASGHWYFTLKDAGAQLKCVMFKAAVQRQIIEPNNGDAISAHGKLSVYDARGEYQLYADEVQPIGGIGDLYKQFEALKAKLLAEGLFDEERKRLLPPSPRQIGIVTSPDAAAFRDIQNVLARRYPLARVILSPTQVQGNDAPPQIVRAIERLNQHTQVDVILLCRGGGSIEDLWCFNDERVARAIAASRIPIISGVGHEIDFTIADFVADVRAPTPSAAAEIATPDSAELRANLRRNIADLQAIAQEKVDATRFDLDIMTRALTAVSPERYIRETRQRIDEVTARLSAQHKRHFALLHERIQTRTAALNAANPDAILKRGYAIITRTDTGEVIAHEKDAPPGTGITIRLQDGELKARTEDKTSHDLYKRTLF